MESPIMAVRAVVLHTRQAWRSVQETHATYNRVSSGKSISGALTTRAVELVGGLGNDSVSYRIVRDGSQKKMSFVDEGLLQGDH